MPSLFGTDGIRGVANEDLTPDLALALGRAAGAVLAPDGGEVVVGRDTRISGPMLESALVAGLCAAGADVRTVGILPTPAIAFLTVHGQARAGAVISASHNPIQDNGIKFFSSDGAKLDAAVEEEIESLIAEPPKDLPTGVVVGSTEPLNGAYDLYIEHLIAGAPEPLANAKVVLDCAYGAAFAAAPDAFRRAGADVVAINAEADGMRINVDCGSTALDGLRKAVIEHGADAGFAFDGDADRVLAVDEAGEVVDGDRIVGLLALDMNERSELTGGRIVATVMSNLGFRRALSDRGIEVLTSQVGDKYVVEMMNETGTILGGEQSGHIVLARHSSTGDGILAALRCAGVVARSSKSFSGLAHFFEPYPQVLVNVEVRDRNALAGATDVWGQVKAVEDQLGSEGRVLVRASGTEPLVRVMVEAPDGAVARGAADRLAAAVRTALA